MILVDTTFLVDALRKKTSVMSVLRKYPDEMLFTTEINVFEIYLGIHSSKTLAQEPGILEKRTRKVDELITKLQVLPFARKEAIEAARILGELKRSGQMIEFRDGLIAGVAKANGITRVITQNEEDFRRVKGIEVINY
jgi:tRNA(fMet)-specific endonuclease VapC